MLDVYTNLRGTTASSFRIAKNGPTIIPGTADPNITSVTGAPGDLFILTGTVPSVYLNVDGNWQPLSTDQKFSRTPVTTGVFIANNNCLYLGVNYAGAVSIYLPAGTPDKRFIIKDESGNASANSITLYPEEDDTIDGQSSYVINVSYNSVEMVYGDVWHVF